jgi:hypothetical protein
MRVTRLLTALAALALVVPATASAAGYPPPADPGKKPPRPGGKALTLKVCKQSSCKYKTIGAAVAAAAGGDTIAVGPGVYKESVKISGARYDKLKLIGNAKNPRSTIIDIKGLKGSNNQNGVIINGADAVTVKGFYARNYKANGFFAVNVDGYTLTNLVAGFGGAYGVYAFNSKGGTISDSEAFYNNDSGFYIGQTPPQSKPKRSIATNLNSWGNVLGWSGTNMRYVTIKNSVWWNNGAGIVPNALSSEKFPPPAFNVITNNDVFWNNFNYNGLAPFNKRNTSTGDIPYPIGVGVLLFGSQDTTIEKNRIYGNWLTGLGMLQQVLLLGDPKPELQEAGVLRRNTVRNNVFGLGGADLNARDMFYPGNGTQNCFSSNTTLSPNVPADGSTFAACPGPAQNTPNDAALSEGLGFVAGADANKPETFEKDWIKHDHKAKPGFKPCTAYDGKANPKALC